MRVAVLGATGRTGSHLVDELAKRGHAVTVLVRDPTRLGPRAARVERVITGDSRSPQALSALLEDADAVASTLGPTGKERGLHQETAGALVDAMDRTGVGRFIGVSGAGIDVPGDQKSPLNTAISKVIQTIGGAAVADKPAEYAVLASSDLDWTLARPPRLRDDPATGRLEHDAHRSTRSTYITSRPRRVPGRRPRGQPVLAASALRGHRETETLTCQHIERFRPFRRATTTR